jgi:uncharacterized membrane protein
MLPFLGLLFAFLGNIFYSLKPNYFIGIRTPWSLEDEQNWRRTHQLAGKVWFAGGLLIILLSMLLPLQAAIIAFISITLIISIIPIVYSFQIYQRTKTI